MLSYGVEDALIWFSSGHHLQIRRVGNSDDKAVIFSGYSLNIKDSVDWRLKFRHSENRIEAATVTVGDDEDGKNPSAVENSNLSHLTPLHFSR